MTLKGDDPILSHDLGIFIPWLPKCAINIQTLTRNLFKFPLETTATSLGSSL